ncbi:MAG TPA: reverse transcriptase family protein [Pseudomonadota bacterium]|nr:reverse transcriptase family protein [Pseudomonadota bacterium]
MSLAALLLELRPLVASVDENWSRILDLLTEHSRLAEYEVARFYVARAMAPKLAQLLRSAEPHERRRAARGVGLTCTRDEAARLLRPLVKDPDLSVRGAARAQVQRLGLTDVALPDTRFTPRRGAAPAARGLWNPTGWSFGLLGVPGSARRRKPRPPRQSARLAKLGLPPLPSVAELLRWLGLDSEAELRRLQRPGAGPGAPYVEFTIPKASGEPRRITAPRPRLKKLQRKILDELLVKCAPHEAAHGFVRGRSVVSNARPHAGAALVIKMDLRDFFPTIHFRRVAGLFQYYGYETEVAAALASLCTHRPQLPGGRPLWPGVLPQGAPTSPALANILCRRLDSRLGGLARRAGATYTRYADDLTFSFATEPERPQALGRFLWWVDQVCQQLGPARRRAGHGPGALVSTPYPGRPSIAGFAADAPL